MTGTSAPQKGSSDAPLENEPARTLNGATVELIQRRISAQVRRNFLYSVGLPGGGSGLVAILWSLLLWLPEDISTYFESGANVQSELRETVRTTAENYLSDANQIRPLVRQEAQLVVPRQVRNSIREEFEAHAVQAMLASEVLNAVSVYFDSSSGTADLERAVASVMSSPDVSELIESTITREIGAAAEQFAQRLEGSLRPAAKVVIGGTMGDTPPEALEKTSYQALEDFLNSQKAQAAREARAPMILTLVIRRGPYYVASAIDLYLRKLAEAFTGQTLRVVVLDNDATFLALIAAEDMLGALQSPDELMRALTSNADEITRDEARHQFESWFPASTRSLRADWSVREALLADSWKPVERASEERAVLDSTGLYVGALTRAELIDAIIR